MRHTGSPIKNQSIDDRRAHDAAASPEPKIGGSLLVQIKLHVNLVAWDARRWS